MGIGRSTYYDAAPAPTDDTAIVEAIAAICEEAIAVGFAYVAVILEAWSRRVVGYAISRSIDARLTMAALKSAIERRKPPPDCMHPAA